ncbi:CG6873 [Drosophila busckii]|uniref:CG6873 n=1 Tax=Drosophila busckii TaxID=30019 RepID=A0A0M4EQJ6_DROBS|nr:cofilin/actin-depolymerizing factor homolog [Drosophila busckii]ALC44555.1 CG6873 [Drosophila busckii]
MSIVRCSSNCIELYEATRKSKQYRYIIYRIVSDAFIDVEYVGAREQNYEDFLAQLMRGGADECRYGLYDLEYTQFCEITQKQRQRERLVLLCWCPAEAKPKWKIQYLSYLRPFMDHLKGIQHYKTAREPYEITRQAVERYFGAVVK